MQAKKVTMSKDSVGSTVPVISVNYSKLIKGFKKLKWERRILEGKEHFAVWKVQVCSSTLTVERTQTLL